LALGGMNGIRAYSTEDGVGDEGAQLSVDLVRQINPQWWAGVLYDAGVVRPHKKALAGDNTSIYRLQGAGFQLGGQQNQWSWALSVAKSFGSTPSTPNALTGKVGDWRANFALTYKH
jgi:hemolysin activation/secretion protein